MILSALWCYIISSRWKSQMKVHATHNNLYSPPHMLELALKPSICWLNRPPSPLLITSSRYTPTCRLLSSVFLSAFVFYHLLPFLTCLLVTFVEFTSQTDVWPLLPLLLPPITRCFSNTRRVIYGGQLSWDHMWHFLPIAVFSILQSLLVPFLTHLILEHELPVQIYSDCLSVGFVCLFASTAFLLPTVCLPDYWGKPRIITYSMLCLRCLLF